VDLLVLDGGVGATDRVHQGGEGVVQQTGPLLLSLPNPRCRVDVAVGVSLQQRRLPDAFDGRLVCVEGHVEDAEGVGHGS